MRHRPDRRARYWTEKYLKLYSALLVVRQLYDLLEALLPNRRARAGKRQVLPFDYLAAHETALRPLSRLIAGHAGLQWHVKNDRCAGHRVAARQIDKAPPQLGCNGS